MSHKYSLLLLLVTLYSSAQIDSIVIKQRIDSISKLDYSNYPHNQHQVFQKLLEDSKKIKYQDGVFRSRMGLLYYYIKYKDLDRLFYHAKQQENFLAKYDNKRQERLYDFAFARILSHHYYLPNLALPYYLKAYESIPIDCKIKFTIELYMIDCYMMINQYDIAIDRIEALFDKELFTRDLSSWWYIQLCIKAVSAYQDGKNYQKSKPLIKDIEAYALKLNDTHIYSFNKMATSRNLYLENSYKQALDTLRYHEKDIKKYTPESLFSYYEYCALCEGELGNYEDAIASLRKSIKEKPMFKLPKLYSTIANYYKAINKKDSTIYYLELRDQHLDSVLQIEEKMYVDYFNTKKENIDIARVNDEILEEKEVLIDQNNDKIWYLWISGLFFFLVVVIYRRLIAEYKFTKKKVVLVNKEKDRLQTKIAIKDRKIAATLVKQEQRLDRLKDIKKEIEENSTINKDYKFRKNLNELNKLIAKGAGKDDTIDELIYQNQEMVSLLKQRFPKLSKTDIAHCILVYMRVNIKESADLLHINTNSVRTSRYRAKSKLGLSKEDSMSQYLDQLVKGGEVSL